MHRSMGTTKFCCSRNSNAWSEWVIFTFDQTTVFNNEFLFMYAIISKDKNNGFEILQTVEINHYFFCLKCPSVILEFNAKVGKKSLRNWLNLV